MRQNPNSRRSRGRGGRKPGSPRNQIFDSNGPGARVRGNSAQIYEKYQQLARDAASSGDRIAAENFYQHAEHYYRLMEAAGLNRNGNAQDSAQQKNDPAAANGQGAANGQAAANGEAATSAEPAAAGAAQATEPATEHPPESVAALIEAVEQGATDSDEAPAGAAANGGDDGEEKAKPARRSRSRRSNGSANSSKAQSTESDEAVAEEGADTTGEDSKPVSA